MEKCKWCGKLAFFSRLSSDGFCISCLEQKLADLEQKLVEERQKVAEEREKVLAANRERQADRIILRGEISKLEREKDELFLELIKKDSSAFLKKSLELNVSISEPDEPFIPEYQGDYAKTVFLHWFSKPKKGIKEWPQYFLYECGIKDCRKFFDEMQKEGYITTDVLSPEKRLSVLKVDELKMLLADMGLKTSGKKAQLIDRILWEVPEAKIEAVLSGTIIYGLSHSGNAFVRDHEQYVILHKHKDWQISWKEFDAAHRTGVEIYDTIWGILNKRVLEEAHVNLGRNAYFALSECAAVRGWEEQSLSFLLKVLYIDLNLGPSFVGLPPELVSRIKRLGDYYTVGMLDDAVLDIGRDTALSKDEFGGIVKSIIAGEYDP